jgi:hypothetical protein
MHGQYYNTEMVENLSFKCQALSGYLSGVGEINEVFLALAQKTPHCM